MLKLEHELAQRSSSSSAQAGNYWAQTVYGYPPKPVRLDPEESVTRTYYRGNCERNSELFNNGNYLTAIFRVNLCDQQHYPLEIGDPVPADGLLLRWEIERARARPTCSIPRS